MNLSLVTEKLLDKRILFNTYKNKPQQSEGK